MTRETTLEGALEIAGNVKEWRGEVFCDRLGTWVERTIIYEGNDSEGNKVYIERVNGKSERFFALNVTIKDIENDGDGYYNEVSPTRQKGPEVAIRELFERVDNDNYEQTLVSNDGVYDLG